MHPDPYQTFLTEKQVALQASGFDVAPEAVHPALFPFQRAIVPWAVRLGRAAIFAERGLGKTFMQLEWGRLVAEETGTKILLVCPLAVAHQTIDEGAKLNIPVTFVRTQAEVDAAPTALLITNYDMLIRDVFDMSQFGGIILDESSILKAFNSRTKQFLIAACQHIPYKLCCTATPSPNDPVELGNHAEFLGVMSSGEMLTRWFIRDSQKANNLRLKGHAVKSFWEWVATWAVCISTPDDLGFDGSAYHLPPLHLHYEMVNVNHARAWEVVENDGQAHMFIDTKLSATNMWQEKRHTLDGRAARAAEIIRAEPNETWLIWHDTDYERDALQAAIPEATTVTGAQDPEEKETRLHAFTTGAARIMSTKASIAGWGLNWQHCARVVFMGVTHKFEEFYQALGRTHRFGQTRPVEVYIIYAESETDIVQSLNDKWKKHTEMHREMSAAMRSVGLGLTLNRPLMSAQLTRQETHGQTYRMINGDSCEELKHLPDNSIGLSVSSWPFSDQYMYSASLRDLGNNDGDEDFFNQMGFILPELYRITIPGRIAVVHAKDRIVYGSKAAGGVMYIEPFSDKCIQAMRAAGFLFFGRITITTDVVRENKQTNRLTNKEMRKDASKMGVGMPEYGLIFRKPPRPENGTSSDERVTPSEDDYSLARWQVDANSYWRSSGGRLLYPWELDGYDYPAHIAHLEHLDAQGLLSRANMTEPIPSDNGWVWSDIQRTDVLNGKFKGAAQDEKHICPLQLDFIERCIVRWSNPGDTVLDYFMGIGSVGVEAVKLGRHAVGVELKPEYYQWACRYLQEAEILAKQPTLFEMGGLQPAHEEEAPAYSMPLTFELASENFDA